MATIATLVFEMSANVARLQSDMSKARSSVDTTMAGIRDAAGIAVRALGALGVGVSAVAFSEMVKSSAEAIDHLRTLSIQTGITVETLSALKGVARASGTDLDFAAGSVNKLEKNMLGAVNGNAKLVAAFADLGISREQLQAGLNDMDSFLPEFAQKLLDSAQGGTLSADAMVLMGKSGAQALPFLKALAEAGQLHGKVTAAQAEEAHKFVVALRTMEERSASLKREFTIGLLPALNAVMGAFTETAVQSDTAREAGEAFGQITRWMAQGIYGVWTALQLAGKLLGAFAAQMDAIKGGRFSEAVSIMREGLADISDTAARAGERIRQMGEEAAKLPPIVRGGGLGGGSAAAGGTSGGGSSGSAAGGGDEDLIVVGGGGTSAPVGAASLAAGGIGGVTIGARSLNNVLKETKVLGKDIGQILDDAGIRSARSMADLRNVLKNVVRELLNMGLSPLLKSARGGANALLGKIFGGDSNYDAGPYGGFGDMSGLDFAGEFAGGGDIPAGAFGVVGENGPELVAGPASVMPAGGGHTYYVNIGAGADPSTVAALQSWVASIDGSLEYRATAAVRRQAARRGRSTAF